MNYPTLRWCGAARGLGTATTGVVGVVVRGCVDVDAYHCRAEPMVSYTLNEYIVYRISISIYLVFGICICIEHVVIKHDMLQYTST